MKFTPKTVRLNLLIELTQEEAELVCDALGELYRQRATPALGWSYPNPETARLHQGITKYLNELNEEAGTQVVTEKLGQ